MECYRQEAYSNSPLWYTDNYRYSGAPEEPIDNKHQELLQQVVRAQQCGYLYGW